MKLCLIDKRDNFSTTQQQQRGDTWKSQLPPSEKGVPNYWFSMMTPVSPVSHYFPIWLAISTFCELFKCALPGKVLQESNIIFDWGHRGPLRNVFWGVEAWTADTTVTVQVCQCYLAQQLRRAPVIQLKRSTLIHSDPRRDIMMLGHHNGSGVCFPIQQFLQSATGAGKNRLHKHLRFKKKKKEKKRPSCLELFC